MSVHVDVYTQLDNSSIRRSANEIQRDLQRAGDEGGQAFASGFEKAAPRIQQAYEKAYGGVANAASKLRAEEAKLSDVRNKAYKVADQVAEAEKKVEHYRTNLPTLTEGLKAAEQKLADVQDRHNSILTQLAVRTEAVTQANIRHRTAISDLSRAYSTVTPAAEDMESSITSVGDAFKSFGSIGLPAVAGGLVALAPIIADVAGVAASAAQSIALLPAAAAAAGAGLGTLMLASTGLDQALKDIRDPVKLSADLYSLSPAAQDVAMSIRQLLPAFDELRAATQDSVFNGTGGMLKQLSAQFLPEIQSLTTGVGSAFNGMLDNLSKELMTPQIQGDFKVIVDNITTAFHNLEPAIAPVTQAIADLTAAGSDFLPDFAKTISDAAQSFSDFIREARDSGKLRDFMQDGLNTLKELGDLAKNVTELFFGFSNEKSRDDLALFSAAIKGIADNTNTLVDSLRVLRDMLFPVVGAMDGLITLAQKMGVIKLPSAADYTSGSAGAAGSTARYQPPPPDPFALPSTTASIGLGTNALVHGPNAGGWTPSGGIFANPGASSSSGSAKLPTAPVLPLDTSLPPGVAGLPQTATLFAAETSYMEANTKLAEKRARADQLEKSNVATAEDIQKARNDVIEAERSQHEAEMRLYEDRTKALEKNSKQMGEIGAALDQDLGISKGLAGIADNLVRFLGSLAAAPFEAKLQAITDASPIKGGFGLMGVLGAQGVFGAQYTGSTGTAGPSGSSPSGGGYPGDAALLSAIPSSGSYNAAGDLSKGLADCSSGVEDLVDLLDGKSTAGRSLNTGNAASVLPGMGFLPGEGGPGDFRIGYNSHHMQATLPGGTPVNYGNPSGYTNAGAGGSGADDPALTQHYYRPAGAGGGASLGSYGGSPLGLGSSGATPVFVVNMPGGGGVGLPSVGGLQGAVGGPGGTPTGAPPGANWDKMAQLEASGNWGLNTGNGFSGGLQFTPSTWNANKPAGAPGQAWQATREQQIAAAENVLKTQGPGAWPNTFTPLGLTGTHAPDLGTGRSGYDPNHPTGGGNFNPGMRIDTSTTSVSPPSTETTYPKDGSPYGFKGSPERSPYAGRSGSISTPATGWEYPIGLPPFHGASPTTGSGGQASTFGQAWNDPTRPAFQLPPGSSPASAGSGGLASASGQVWNDPTRPTVQLPPGGGTPLPPMGLPAIPGQGGTPAPAPGSIGGIPTPPQVTPHTGGTPPAPTGQGTPQGPGVGPTQIGGGPGLSGTGKGALGVSDGLMGAAMTAAGGLDMIAPGMGQVAQTGMKLANRAIQYGGQVAGIMTQGALDTWLPFGGSQLASNGWFTKIIGGLAGAAPALPNMAGKAASGMPKPGGDPQQGQQSGGDTHITVNNNRPTEDGTGRDIAYHAQNMYQPAGMP